MKKPFAWILRVIAICMLLLAIGTIYMTIASSMISKEWPTEVENMAEINLREDGAYGAVYFEEIEILRRYAFKTESSYRNEETGRTYRDYHYYSGTEPMDDNELVCEYYIVKFKDQTGREFIAAMSIQADKQLPVSLENCPVKLSLCADAEKIAEYNPIFSVRELENLTKKALAGYFIDEAEFTLDYSCETAEEYVDHDIKSQRTIRRLAGGGGLLLAIVAFIILRFVNRKRKV